MAGDAAQQIRAFDPVGPYYLISYCAMGNVALETARQLRAAGSNVPIQFLVDTVAAGYVEGMSRMDRLLRRLHALTASSTMIFPTPCMRPIAGSGGDRGDETKSGRIACAPSWRPI